MKMEFVLQWLSSLDPTIATIIVSVIILVINVIIAFTKTSNKALTKKLRKLQLQLLTTFDSDSYQIVTKNGEKIDLNKCTLKKKEK